MTGGGTPMIEKFPVAQRNRRWSGLIVAVLFAVAATAGCRPEETGPYLAIEGGGFIFNYRISEAYYGFVARPLRDLPEGAILEARFENPDGTDPITVRQAARASAIRYTFRTPPLKGVEADRDYRAELVVLDAGGVKELGRYARTFRTYIGQDVIAEKPLTVGPGYALNPEAGWSDRPAPRPQAQPASPAGTR
jgi:hypothetical protein